MKQYAGLVIVGLMLARCAGAADFVYVSIAGENRIAAYALEAGQLRHLGDTSVSGGPGALCVSPDQEYLYASIRSVGNLAAFRIESDGSLTQASEVTAGADPAYLAVDPSGKHLVSAYYRAGSVMVHPIGSGGQLGAEATQSTVTDEKAHAVVFDRSGKFVFVPHTGPNAIFQFRFQPVSGTLQPNQPAKLVRDANTGPRHLWFHPQAPFAYGSDEQGNSITVYRFDTAAGTLEPIQTLSSLPPGGFSGRKSTSDIEVHPTGKFVYIANRGHDSISCFAIDQATGKLRYLSNAKTEKTPRSFNIDAEGRYLIAAGQNSATLATYRIALDGSLQATGRAATGNKPWWVLFVKR